MAIVIAEFGNNHLGEYDQAVELIRAARDCGAHLAKGQAFVAKDIQGSMPPEFYEQCQLSVEEYIELIEYGKSIGIPVFFSLFSAEVIDVYFAQYYQKISASVYKQGRAIDDEYTTFVSVPWGEPLLNLRQAHVMYVTPYLTTHPKTKRISDYSLALGRRIGFSDHTLGPNQCFRAIETYGAHVIEKHFTLRRDLYFGGTQFRDAIHAATPKQLEAICKVARNQTDYQTVKDLETHELPYL